MKIRNKSRRGFTLVELLAVLVIVGILSAISIAAVSNLINRARDEGKVSDKKMLELSAKSYLQNNSDKLPKVVGTSTIIKATTLKDSNYLKQDLIDSNGDSCMENSVVRVYKNANQKYTYNTYIYCKGDEIPSEVEGVKPEVEVTFMDRKGNKQKPPEEGTNTDVNSAVVQIKYKGGKTTTKEDIGLAGYSYIISVKYKNDVDDSAEGEYVEISNSGTLNASGRTDITVKKDISKFIDITKASNIRVTVQANNEDGGSFKGTFDSNYYDSVAPECGEIIGQAGENEWDRTIRERTITVRCLDGDGSGCIKDSFTKTFNTEAKDGYITIRDNANNTARCKVRVHLDWTPPTLTINAYKRNSNGTPGEIVGTVTANSSNKNAVLKTYKNGYGSDNWLNKANYPDGVYYEVIGKDNLNNSTGVWNLNAEGLKKGAPNITSVTKNFEKLFTSKDDKTHFSIVGDGYRYGVYKITDEASNEATITINAPLDTTPPTVAVVGLYKKGSAADISSPAGLATYQNNTWLKGWVFTQATGATDAVSGIERYEYTTTGATANVTNARGTYRNINADGISYIQYRACDIAGNCRPYESTLTIKLDRSAPTIPNVLMYKWANNNDSSQPTPNSIYGLESYASSAWSNKHIFTMPSGSVDTGVGSEATSTITYRYTTKGKTSNSNNTAAGFRNIKAEGKSSIKWQACDSLGNCSKFTDYKKVFIDKTKPTCVKKAVAWSKGGKTGKKSIEVGCKDTGGSECKKDAFKKTYSGKCVVNATGDKGIEISDNAGNTRKCDVDVLLDTENPTVNCTYLGDASNNDVCKASHMPYYFICEYRDTCSGLNQSSRKVTWGKPGPNTRSVNESQPLPCVNGNYCLDTLCTVDSQSAGATVRKLKVCDNANRCTKLG